SQTESVINQEHAVSCVLARDAAFLFTASSLLTSLSSLLSSFSSPRCFLHSLGKMTKILCFA
ncbi:MAG: hypothetical protein J6P20_03830, partial [Oscillospiraceae bacterium]|nr:hypothetical protein [Oscillospiraceae bacterium]